MLHRMTVTGQRICSPLSDPINRMVISGAEVDGDDSHPNEPDPMPAPMSFCPVCAQPVEGDPNAPTMHVHEECQPTWEKWWAEIKSVLDYDDCDAPTLINADTYPMLMNRWEPGPVRSRQ